MRRIALGLGGLLALLLPVGSGYEVNGRRIAARDFPPRGRLVDIGGRRIQLDRQGAGTPTIVFRSGLGGAHADPRDHPAPSLADLLLLRPGGARGDVHGQLRAAAERCISQHDQRQRIVQSSDRQGRSRFMPTSQLVAPLLFAAGVALAASPTRAQQTRDSSAEADSARPALVTPPWRDSVRYGGGLSVGAPPSDYTGAAPPSTWCLQADGRASGDLGRSGSSWTKISRSWLHQVLSDTTDFREGWREVLGSAPRLTPQDSISQVTDEGACRDISNARMGEFGYAVGMSLRREILGVATW